MERSARQGLGTLPASFCLTLSVAPGNARDFDLWRSGLSPIYTMDAPNARARSSFGSEMTAYQFDDVAIASGKSSAATYERTAETIGRSGVDYIGALVYTDGGCALDIEGRADEVHVGDVCFLDMTRASTLRSPAHNDLSIILPRRLVEPNLADPDGLHGRILRRSSPLNTMLVSHLRAFEAEAPTLGLSEARAAARATAALIATFAGNSAEGRETVARFAETHILQIARRIIDANINKPDLRTDFICRQLGVSRAKLYRLFEPIGGISQFIRQRRLKRAYQDIADPRRAQEHIGAIAARYGFSSVSVFSRAFRQTYSVSPSELRDGVRRTGNVDVSHPGDSPFEAMKQWLLGAEASC
jgi:AraC-like DNA-binding protein